MKALLIAALAVTVSGAAFAKDLNGSVMTDSEMDKVTAGEAANPTPGGGLDTAGGVASFHALQNANPLPLSTKGLGLTPLRDAPRFSNQMPSRQVA
jgi:hypothetical protein